ncbi:MAG: thioredoxin [Eggerthellaceae bacterium]|nr:thioredoxin [Eggerthellaceae bacterium]
MAQPINAADFQSKVIENDKPVLVDFFATWCGPCRMMAPVIEEVAAEKAGAVDVYQLDIDENPQVAQAFGVMSVPTFIVFKDGKPYNKTIGAQPKEQILALFD